MHGASDSSTDRQRGGTHRAVTRAAAPACEGTPIRPLDSRRGHDSLQDPLVGRVLDGRYRVESRLARGGMATVYEALDTRLDRPVALKVMHPGLADDEEFVSRFIREAKSAARLSHPNVVAVFDQGADQGHVFLAMEYVARPHAARPAARARPPQPARRRSRSSSRCWPPSAPRTRPASSTAT